MHYLKTFVGSTAAMGTPVWGMCLLFRLTMGPIPDHLAPGFWFVVGIPVVLAATCVVIEYVHDNL